MCTYTVDRSKSVFDCEGGVIERLLADKSLYVEMLDVCLVAHTMHYVTHLLVSKVYHNNKNVESDEHYLPS